MKAQYVGDINDYRKYALLRSLRQAGVKVGIHWMLTPDDGSTDGHKRAYLAQAERWRHHDPDLFEALRQLAADGRSANMQTLQAAPALAGFKFFSQIVPDDLAGRRAAMRAGHKHLAPTDLVFFDPDNGLDVPSTPKGKPSSSKYVYGDEVKAEYLSGKAVLVYQHYPRIKRAEFEKRLAERLERLCPAATVWFLTTAHVVFVLTTHPEHAIIRKAVQDLTHHPDMFVLRDYKPSA